MQKVGVLKPYLPRLGRRIPTRLQTSKDAPGDAATNPEYVIDTEAMRASGPEAFRQNAGLLRSYTQQRIAARNPDKVVDEFRRQVADRLLFIYQSVPGAVRDRSRRWYEGANRHAVEMADKHGVSVEASSAVLAALSPQKDWFQNASLAERVMDVSAHAKTLDAPGFVDEVHFDKARQLFAGDRYADDLAATSRLPYEEMSPKQKAMWLRSFDEAFNDRTYRVLSPEGEFLDYARKKDGGKKVAAWGSLAEIAKAVQAYENPDMGNISRLMGSQHKVRNFYNNIVDPTNATDVTIDTHAIGAGALHAVSGEHPMVLHNFGNKVTGSKQGPSNSAKSGAQGTYGAWADAYRDAATQAGILPREMQSITWEAVRGLFPAELKKGMTGDVAAIWEMRKRGYITEGEARESIVQYAGYFRNPEWFKERAALLSIGVPAGMIGASEAEAYEHGQEWFGPVPEGVEAPVGREEPATPLASQRWVQGLEAYRTLAQNTVAGMIGDASTLGGMLMPWREPARAEAAGDALAESLMHRPGEANPLLDAVGEGIERWSEQATPYFDALESGPLGRGWQQLPERVRGIIDSAL